MFNFSKKAIFGPIIATFLIVLVGLAFVKDRKQTKDSSLCIGILSPMDHPAMQQIINGFKEQFIKLYKKPVTFNVQCAQGDPTLMRAIIQSFVSQGMSIIAPIGKRATQMCMSMVTNQPVVSLAADLSEQERLSYPSCSLTGVCDEISRPLQVEMIKNIIPGIKKFTIICSSTSEKDFPAISEIINEASRHGITVQKCMIQTMNEIYTISKIIDPDSQAIFVLKDHLVISGISTLVQEAKKRVIPVITSDNGSVENGATIALGVQDQETGKFGANLAIKIIRHEVDIKSTPVEKINNLAVFISKNAKTSKPAIFEMAKKYADNQNYKLLEC